MPVAQFLAIRGAFFRPTFVHRLCWIGSYLDIGAMVIGVTARVVKRMLCHELYDLQSAFLTTDVRDHDICFKRVHRTGWTSGVDEQTICQDRNLHWVLDGGGYGHRATLAISRRCLWIRRKFSRRIDRESNPIVAGM